MKNSQTFFISSFFIFFFLNSYAILAVDTRDFLQCFSSYPVSSLIYTPSNSSFESILFSSIQNLRPTTQRPILKPLAIITPSEESQIPIIITCSRSYGIEIRTRSGGHDYEGLSFVSESSFIILDLRNLRSVTVDTESKTLWVQAGATLGELYYNIANKSKTLAFPAGSCPTVGVGGHISGGGFGPLARKYGLAIDNIIDVHMVDVNGQILSRKFMGEDLFWAIRGGGGASFGVILAWKLNLVSVPKIVTYVNATRTSEQNATALIHRWQYIADRMDENLVLSLFVRSANSSQNGNKTVEVLFTSVYLGGIEQLLQVMQESFPELGLTREECTEMSWIESVLAVWQFPRGSPLEVLLNRTARVVNSFKAKSDYVTKPISEKGLLGLWDILYEEVGSSAVVQFNPYGGRLSEISESELPFPHRAGNIYLLHYSTSWVDNDDQESGEAQRHMDWIRKLYSYMESYVSKKPRAAYMNYRDLDLGRNNIRNTSYAQARIWGTKYFKNNFNRLVQVKTKVDSANFFRNEQSIPSVLISKVDLSNIYQNEQSTQSM